MKQLHGLVSKQEGNFVICWDRSVANQELYLQYEQQQLTKNETVSTESQTAPTQSPSREKQTM